MSVRSIRLVIAALWTLVTLAGVFYPIGSPSLSVLVHVVLFAGLAGLWAWTFPRLALLAVVVAVFVAVGTEAVQLEIVAGRGIQTRDLWADFAGILLGWGAAMFWHRRRSRLPRYRRRRYRGRPAPSSPRTNAVVPRRSVGSSVHA